MKHIAYYVTAHGYGHAVRTSALCNFFSPDIQLTFKTTVPRIFFEEEVKRPFGYVPVQFDCGCIQHDGITVDIGKTLQRYMEIADHNESVLKQEIAWCREHNVDCIVCDITPFACEIARQAGIVSIAAGNFSWVDIYQPYTAVYPHFLPYLEKMKQQYLMAQLLLALTPSNTMSCFKNRVSIPPVGRCGVQRIEEIRDKYAIASHKKIGLIYTGNFGFDAVEWEKLQEFQNWEFIGMYPIPQHPSNYHCVEKTDFPYQDLFASADVVISKIGYGIYTDCLYHGVPLLYVPRENFAEHPVLENALLQWGHAYSISPKKFISVDWGIFLEKVLNTPRPHRIVLNGAESAAYHIETFIR